MSECALTLVGSSAATSDFELSPHGAFRDGSVLYVLRGQKVAAYTAVDFGELVLIQESTLEGLGARESKGGVAFQNGRMFISGESGLEIWDVRNVGAGIGEPVRVSLTPGLHYRRIAVRGSLLAGLYPGTDLPCAPGGTLFCHNTIDIVAVSNLASPVRIAMISSLSGFGTTAFNDLAFNREYLYAATEHGIVGYNLLAPTSPSVLLVENAQMRGKFLVSNGNGVLGVGNDQIIHMYNVSSNGVLTRFTTLTIPFGAGIDRANPIAFHPQAWVDSENGRVITMINEIDPLTLEPARTIAFDVFDYSVPMWEGSFERGYEDLTFISPDEVKYNPLAAGTSVFTVGELSGLQVWAGCGAASGRIDWHGTQGMNCGGAELRGWVSGPQRIDEVEIFLGGASLGIASLNGTPRNDVSSKHPVQTWRLVANLDQTPRGEHVLRAVATDFAGVRRQFAEQRVFFNGPGQNCTNRRRSAR
ncbi:MAG TPA: hypothetical protein VM779_06305 [Thermoanaerobaculia bacterium]|nr:hypothetical protein [Thermoanaerobaculia bacterium]